MSANEIDVSFLFRYANQVRCIFPIAFIFIFADRTIQYPKAIRLVAGGLINVRPLVTHRFPLEEAVAAFKIAADPSQGAIKVQIHD